ncbi:MAG: T9SS type A sorting domain-containing protein, partial [Ignavibacteria bacterium]|nr:T9SS type A sorting domain-containing protein [Ignavibacteria bacterium]
TNDSCGVFLSRSTDGGNTWIDFEISDHNFKPEPIGGLGQGYQGDNIGLTSSQGFLFPIWMDNSTGIYQAWSAKIEIAKLTKVDSHLNQIDLDFKLFQNYPNPFNDKTIIKFYLPKTSYVKLKVFDLLGRELFNLIDGEKSAGDYQVEFNSSIIELAIKKVLPSGVYLYQLVYGDKQQTKKMILLR